MEQYKKLNAEGFSNFLLTLKDGDTVNFGCTCDSDLDGSDLDWMKIENWYFAKIIHIDKYDSRFILIDYCGGEEAFAIPLNNYSEERDEDDKRIVSGAVKKFFKENDYLGSTDDFVYVEIETKDD